MASWRPRPHGSGWDVDPPILALTPGEPSGIGPECVLRLSASRPVQKLVAIADPDLLRTVAQDLGIAIGVTEWQPGQECSETELDCLPVAMAGPATPGHPDPANAEYVLECVRQAVNLVRSGGASAMVTGPVHKGVINDAGIAFSGHTEFLAELARVDRVVMMLVAGQLRVALVTTHLPLRAVPDAITREGVAQTIRITHSELASRFGIAQPSIQVLGLNPHAGEGGHLGSEDAEVIAPAIADCRDLGIECRGPVPADSAFTRSALDGCDAVVAMYHDQGLPVLKHAGFGTAVNITLGLPFIRTSVDHGTALDIAGQGLAKAASLEAAVDLAWRLCRQRTG